MTIRNLRRSDDRLAVSRVYEESWKYAYRGIIPEDYLNSIPAGRWAAKLDDPGMRNLVMIEGEAIIGAASYCPARAAGMEGFGEIVSIYLLPEYMGKGCGAKLLAAAIDGLRQMDFHDIYLWVLEENLPARRFYEKHGFFAADIYLADNIGGRPLREVQYRRRI